MNFTNPHFAEPQWLWLAMLGPAALLALQLWSGRARRRQLAQLATTAFMPSLTRSHSPVRRAFKNALLVLGVGGVGLALARPQWGEQEDTSRLLGEDVVFVFDCSRSMLATDVSPNRLQRAKLAISDFVQRHADGRVGLVAFAGQAFLQCPLTFDHGAFLDALSALDDKTIPIPGSDLGRGLSEAFEAMEKNDRRKLVVLVTDGEDLEKSGVRTAEVLATHKVVVFALGVGTASGTELRVINEQGQPEVVRDSKGETVRSRLDETTLRAIAQATGGGYYPLGPLGEGLAKVQRAFEKMTVSGETAPARRRGVERFYIPIACALFLLVLESLTSTRRRGTVFPRLAPAATVLMVSATGLLAETNSTAPGTNHTATLHEPSGTGVSPVRNETDGRDARATTAAPSTPRESYNAGTRKLRDGKLGDAETFLQTAVASESARLQPAALYNLGHARFSQGVEELKKSPDGRKSSERTTKAAAQADTAIEAADEALASNDVQKMVAAYVRGRGVRKELKEATAAVRLAMEKHGNTLAKWRRASGDFKSALELQVSFTDAQFNADVTDRYIAKLVDSIQQLQQASQCPGNKGKELAEKLKGLKGRIPQPMMPPGAAGDEEEEEDLPNGPQPGTTEGPSRDGQELPLSPEDAGRLLDGFKLDGERRLPMGQGDQAKPKDPSRKTW